MRQRDVLRLAKAIANDYWKSEEFIKRPDFGHLPADWDRLTKWNQENFLFMARWHMARLKAAERRATSPNKRQGRHNRLTRGR